VVFVELQAALPAERKLLVLGQPYPLKGESHSNFAGLALVSPVLTLLTMPVLLSPCSIVSLIVR